MKDCGIDVNYRFASGLRVIRNVEDFATPKGGSRKVEHNSQTTEESTSGSNFRCGPNAAERTGRENQRVLKAFSVQHTVSHNLNTYSYEISL